MKRFLILFLCICTAALFQGCSTEPAEDESGTHTYLDGIVALGNYKGIEYTVNKAPGTDGLKEARKEIMAKVMAAADISKDLDEEIEKYGRNSREFYGKIAETYYSVSPEEYFEMFYGTENVDYGQLIDETSSEAVKVQYVLAAVAEAEQIKLNEGEYTRGVVALMEEFGYTDRSEFIKSAGGVDIIREALLLRKAQNVIFNSAVPVYEN